MDGYIDRNALVPGRIVDFGSDRECRAAIVVRVFSATCVNLHVFGDGSGDGLEGLRTSIVMGDGPGKFHDPRVCPHVKAVTG